MLLELSRLNSTPLTNHNTNSSLSNETRYNNRNTNSINNKYSTNESSSISYSVKYEKVKEVKSSQNNQYNQQKINNVKKCVQESNYEITKLDDSDELNAPIAAIDIEDWLDFFTDKPNTDSANTPSSTDDNNNDNSSHLNQSSKQTLNSPLQVSSNSSTTSLSKSSSSKSNNATSTTVGKLSSNLIDSIDLCSSLEDLVKTFDQNVKECLVNYKDIDIGQLAPVQVRSQDDIINDSQIWYTLTGNFGNLLPIDYWSKSLVRKYHNDSLNIKRSKNKRKPVNNNRVKNKTKNSTQNDKSVNKISNNCNHYSKKSKELISNTNLSNNNYIEKSMNYSMNSPEFESLFEDDLIDNQFRKRVINGKKSLCENDYFNEENFDLDNDEENEDREENEADYYDYDYEDENEDENEYDEEEDYDDDGDELDNFQEFESDADLNENETDEFRVLPNKSKISRNNSHHNHDTGDIDFLEFDEDEEELREQLDMHSMILSKSVYNDDEFDEPLITAEQVLNEIDSMMTMQEECFDEMTPDSGCYSGCGGLNTSISSHSNLNQSIINYGVGDLSVDLNVSYLKYINTFAEHNLNNNSESKEQNKKSLNKSSLTCKNELNKLNCFELNEIIEQIETNTKELSDTLVQELALRDELEFEKETRNTFISLLMSIQEKRRNLNLDSLSYSNHRHFNSTTNLSINFNNSCNSSTNLKKKNRKSLINFNFDINNSTHLTTIIPYNSEIEYTVQHLQILNKLLRAINEDSHQVPELLTNYILKVVCPT